mmetsp:Transcript_6661/g.16386  ORF Transcript_6661/g.16386 Transcript_6661/m.16386 type:complete len:80 (+) Transcript_6661:1093-1332(+)
MGSHPFEHRYGIVLLFEFEIQWFQLRIVTAEFAVGKAGPVDGNAWINCTHNEIDTKILPVSPWMSVGVLLWLCKSKRDL